MGNNCKVCQNNYVDEYGLCTVCGYSIKSRNSIDILAIFILVLLTAALVKLHFFLYYIFLILVFASYIIWFFLRRDKKVRKKIQSEKLVYPHYFLHSNPLKAIESLQKTDKIEYLAEAALFWDKKRENRDMLCIVLENLLPKTMYLIKKIEAKRSGEQQQFILLEALQLMLIHKEELKGETKHNSLFNFLREKPEIYSDLRALLEQVLAYIKNEENDNAKSKQSIVEHKNKSSDPWAFDRVETRKKICGSCKKVVAFSQIVGNRCSFCGVLWIDEEQMTLLGEQPVKNTSGSHWSKYPNLIPLLLELPLSEEQFALKGSMTDLIKFFEKKKGNSLLQMRFETEGSRIYFQNNKPLPDERIVIVRNQSNAFSWKCYADILLTESGKI